MSSDPVHGVILRVADLAMGKTLGVGGQGSVYELNGELAGYIYKEYSFASPRSEALSRLVAVLQSLPQNDRVALEQQSAWPVALVTDGGRVKGFIMPKAPPHFWARTAAGLKLRELQYL